MPLDLFLILDNLLCKGESLNRYNMFSHLRKIESNLVPRALFSGLDLSHGSIKRASLTEKFMICLSIYKCSCIFFTP